MAQHKDINYLSIDSINIAEALMGECPFFDNASICIVFKGRPHDTQFLFDGQLYQVAEARIIIVLEGTASFTLDLESFQAKKGTVVIGPPNIIADVQEASPDLKAIVFILKEDLNITDNIVLHTSPAEFDQILRLAYLTWDMAHEEPFRKSVIFHLVQALADNIYDIHHARPQDNSDKAHDRQQQLFQDFKHLVQLHCERHRTIPFYAAELGISPHHLSAVIKDVSGHPVMYWVNRAIILRAKVLLNLPNMMTYEVAHRLNFSSSSAFHNFFKRITEMTPKEYQMLHN